MAGLYSSVLNYFFIVLEVLGLIGIVTKQPKYSHTKTKDKFAHTNPQTEIPRRSMKEML